MDLAPDKDCLDFRKGPREGISSVATEGDEQSLSKFVWTLFQPALCSNRDCRKCRSRAAAWPCLVSLRFVSIVSSFCYDVAGFVGNKQGDPKTEALH
mmetsp:Transcript_22685/g.65350  ORF Transcript_22685/g.65350 Transcript_22685/m.65350 type:complete len:97 (+) Transcript_22685:1210-1500(+)